MEIFQSLCEGFLQNIILFLVTLVGSLPLGLLIMFCVRSAFKPLSWLAKLFVWIIRGTPLMLQLFIVFYLPSVCFGWSYSERIYAAMIAFIINYACYFSEIFRGGIESVPVGQNEAGRVLGITRKQVFFRVILMQVVKRIIAPVGNEIITLIKDTSLARIIAVGEIIMMSERQLSRGIIWPFFSTAVFFLAFTGVVTLLLSYTEKKLDYYKV